MFSQSMYEYCKVKKNLNKLMSGNYLNEEAKKCTWMYESSQYDRHQIEKWWNQIHGGTHYIFMTTTYSTPIFLFLSPIFFKVKDFSY